MIVRILTIPLLITLFLAPLPLEIAGAGHVEELTVHIFGQESVWILEISGIDLDLPRPDGVGYEFLAVSARPWSDRIELLTSLGFIDAPLTSGAILEVKGIVGDEVVEGLEEGLKLGFEEYEGVLYSGMDMKEWLEVVKDDLFSGLDGMIDLVKPRRRDFSMLKIEYNGTFTLIYAENGEGFTGNEISIGDLLDMEGIRASASSSRSVFRLKLHDSLLLNHTEIGYERYEASPDGIEIELPPDTELPNDLKIWVVRPPPLILAIRSVDRAVVRSGEGLEVRVRLENLGGIEVENLTVNEGEWLDRFEVVRGTPEEFIESLGPNATYEYSYILRAKAGVGRIEARGEILYHYTLLNKTYEASARLNTLDILVNMEGPSISVEARPASIEYPFGSIFTVDVSVENIGSKPAFDISLAGEIVRDSLVEGDEFTRRVELSFANMSITSRSIEMGYKDGAGREMSTESNSLDLFVKYVPDGLPMLEVVKYAEIVDDRVIVTISLRASKDIEGLKLGERLPEGVRLIESDLEAGDEGMYELLDLDADELLSLDYSLEPLDIKAVLIPPTEIGYEWYGIGIFKLSPIIPVPIGLHLEKAIEPGETFVAGSIEVEVRLRNLSGEWIYGVRLRDREEASMELISGDTEKDAVGLRPGGEISLTYSVKAIEVGDYELRDAEAGFLLYGTYHDLFSNKPTLKVYGSPGFDWYIEPETPIEGREFRFRFEIRNGSGLDIRDLRLDPGLPEGIEVEGALERPILEAGGIWEGELVMKPRSALTIHMKPRLTYTYHGSEFEVKYGAIGITVEDDIVARYAIPIAIGISIVLLAGMVKWEGRREIYNSRH